MASVPTRVLTPIVEEHMTRNRMTLHTMAVRLGMGTNNLTRSLYESSHVHFNTADRIVTTGMRMPQLWLVEPLSEFYLTVPADSGTLRSSRTGGAGGTSELSD